MYFLGRTQMMTRYSIIESLYKIRKSGFDGAEISILDRDFKVRGEFFDSEHVQQLKEALEELNFSAFSLSAHMDYVNSEENYEYIRSCFPIAKQLGTDVMIINGAVKKEGTTDEWSRMIQRTRKLCDSAVACGMNLAKEFEPNFICGNTSELRQTFEEVDAPNLYANLDIGHVFLCDPDPLQAIESLRGKILHVHIENMAKGVHDHLLPDEGDMDLNQYISKLREVGFDGPAALDIYKYDYESVCSKAVTFLKALNERGISGR